jgi:hypothetical protein
VGKVGLFEAIFLKSGLRIGFWICGVDGGLSKSEKVRNVGRFEAESKIYEINFES